MHHSYASLRKGIDTLLRGSVSSTIIPLPCNLIMLAETRYYGGPGFVDSMIHDHDAHSASSQSYLDPKECLDELGFPRVHQAHHTNSSGLA